MYVVLKFFFPVEINCCVLGVYYFISILPNFLAYIPIFVFVLSPIYCVIFSCQYFYSFLYH